MLKILIHDWPAHAFPISLSRELAHRGHEVYHVFFEGVQGPKGSLVSLPTDPKNFSFVRRTLDQPYEKYRAFKRYTQEKQYGREIAAYVQARQPDVIISSNTPLDVQKALLGAAERINASFVFWLQDFLSVGIKNALRFKHGWGGGLVGDYYGYLESRLLQKSDHVVCICQDFKQLASAMGVESALCSVIENWASREEIRPLPKDNIWSRHYGLVDKTVFLYAGTLGLKHNPELLLKLARACQHESSQQVVVASEGLGADWLRAQIANADVPNLLLLPYQKYEDLPVMLASADVLVGLVETEAASFSVPSKVLSYMAAGRAVLFSVPSGNQVAKILSEANAGIVVTPGEDQKFVEAAHHLGGSPDLRTAYAKNARQYAEQKFDIVTIADQFIDVIDKAIATRRHRSVL